MRPVPAASGGGHRIGTDANHPDSDGSRI